MLVATILSAQTTDRSVNAVTPVLFARYPDAAALAHADPRAVEALIKPTGFFRTKAKTIIAASAALVERFHGEVPPRMRTPSPCRGWAGRPPTSGWAAPSAFPGSLS